MAGARGRQHGGEWRPPTGDDLQLRHSDPIIGQVAQAGLTVRIIAKQPPKLGGTAQLRDRGRRADRHTGGDLLGIARQQFHTTAGNFINVKTGLPQDTADTDDLSAVR